MLPASWKFLHKATTRAHRHVRQTTNKLPANQSAFSNIYLLLTALLIHSNNGSFKRLGRSCSSLFRSVFSRTQRQANDSHFRSWKLQKRENLKIDLVGALTMACNLMKPNKKPNKILNDFCSLKRPISDFKPKVNLRRISPKTLLSFLQKLSWHLNLSSRFSPQFATSYSKPYSEQRVWV